PRDLVHDVFNRKHALRAAEAAEGGVRHRVRFAAMRHDADVLQEVRVVAMEHRAVVDGAGKIRRHATARGEHELDAFDTAGIVEADVVVDDEVVALAGHDHVVVAIQPELAGLAGVACHHGRDTGDECRLALLAAERAAHAPAFDHDVLEMPGRSGRREVLYLAGVLSRAVYRESAVLAREHHRDLALQVELVLPADAGAAASTVFRLFDRRATVASLYGLGR